MRRRLLVPAALLAAMLGLAGCSSGMSGLSEASYDSDGAAPEIGQRGLETIDGGGSEQAEDVAGGEQYIVTGTISITVEEPLDAADDVARIVEGAGGHVDRRVETAPRDDDRGRAEITVRIPADRLTATLEQIEELGEVEESNTSRQNVTAVAKDLDARITALEASVDRLLALMVDADTTADLITIESALSQRQAELESLQSQRRSLADQVEYSTITLFLGSEQDAPVDEPDTFLSGLIAGWEALVAFLLFLLVAVGVVLPWLILPAIALLIVWLLVRRSRRRRRASAAGDDSGDASGDATDEG